MAARIVGDERRRDGSARPRRWPDPARRPLARASSTATRCATGCSRRSASTRANSSSRPARRPPWRIATWPPTRPSRPSRTNRCAARDGRTGSIASMPSSTISGRALEWGLEAEPWTAVRMATALLPYWAVRVMSQDNDDRIVAAIEIARARVVGVPDADPADQALAARLLGEAARLWAMSGRAAVALGWAEDAMLLAEASGDPVGAARRLAGLVDRDRLLGSGRARRDGCAGHLRARDGPGGGDRRVVGPRARGGVLRRPASAPSTRMAARPSCSAASTRRTIRQSVRDRRRGDGAGPDARAPGQDGCRGRRLRRGDPAFHGAWRRTVRARPSGDMAHALRRGRRFDEALALYRETIGSWVHLGHKGRSRTSSRTSRTSHRAGRRELAVRLLGAAEAIREAADAGWPSTRTGVPRAPWNGSAPR